MKKSILFLLLILFFTSLSTAQPFKNGDTVVVFQASTPVPGKISKYIIFKKGNVFTWVDHNDISHKSKISKITAGFLLLGADTVFPADVKSLVLSGPSAIMLSDKQMMISSEQSDSLLYFSVMSYLEFEKLSKTEFIKEAKEHNDPFYKHVSAEKYAADMDEKIQRSKNMFAALDTCPLHYGIKTNLVRDLVNEINLNFELPIKRNLCLDMGAGIWYAKPDASRYDFAYFLTTLTNIRGRHITMFDQSYLYRKGFSLEVIPKIFLSKKKHLYLGPQLGFHYYYYTDKLIFLNADGSDYYHRSFYAIQSEKSAAVNLNAIIGVQTPQIKKFLFDAFFSIGMMYRGGVVSRSAYIVYHHEGSVKDYYNPPLELKDGGIFLSVQLGFRIGWRFGKAKLYG